MGLSGRRGDRGQRRPIGSGQASGFAQPGPQCLSDPFRNFVSFCDSEPGRVLDHSLSRPVAARYAGPWFCT